MTFWWMEPGWRQTRCAKCGADIWPDGDPDWGLCYECFYLKYPRDFEERTNLIMNRREEDK